MWDVLELRWTEGYEHLKSYKAREGDCRVPQAHKEDDGFTLGRWVSTQRKSAAKGKLSAKRIALLNELGFVWEVREK